MLDRTQRRLTLPATCPHFPQGVRRSGEIQELGYILDAFKALANAWQTGSLPDSVFSVAIWAHRFLSRLGSLAQRPLHAPHHTVPIVTPPSVSSVRRRQGLARLRDIRLLCLCIRDPVLLGSSHHAFLGEKTHSTCLLFTKGTSRILGFELVGVIHNVPIYATSASIEEADVKRNFEDEGLWKLDAEAFLAHLPLVHFRLHGG